jgi:hypothetical protein
VPAALHMMFANAVIHIVGCCCQGLAWILWFLSRRWHVVRECGYLHHAQGYPLHRLELDAVLAGNHFEPTDPPMMVANAVVYIVCFSTGSIPCSTVCSISKKKKKNSPEKLLSLDSMVCAGTGHVAI